MDTFGDAEKVVDPTSVGVVSPNCRTGAGVLLVVGGFDELALMGAGGGSDHGCMPGGYEGIITE